MCRRIMLVVTLFLTMVASAEQTQQTLLQGEILNCQNQKCNFECLANGQWMRLGNTGKSNSQDQGFFIDWKQEGFFQIWLANEADPVYFIISSHEAFCQFKAS